jgi:imidazole glycerol-phosphate synthase subunit HisH
MSVVIIDYGMGNLASIKKAIDFLGIPNSISSQKDVISQAKAIILPGVGSFSKGMENLKNSKLDILLTEEVIRNKKPFLGICLGMQLISTFGTEPIETEGLGWIEGNVKKIIDSEKRIPHLGWNNIHSTNNFFNDFNEKDFYFIHSYHFEVENEIEIAAMVNYGGNYVAAIQKDNIFATQFHPEKSQEYGLKFLSKFFKENA